jgi:hypothetical protein
MVLKTLHISLSYIKSWQAQAPTDAAKLKAKMNGTRRHSALDYGIHKHSYNK